MSAIEKALSVPRIGRYLGEAQGDKNYALRLYVWNGRLCEAFYIPSQTAEISIRNGIQRALAAQYGANWYERTGFLCTLKKEFRGQLDGVVRDKRFSYGARLTADHIVSSLMLGFWLNLLTSRYDGALWPKHIHLAFPRKPTAITRQDIFDSFDRLREFRNKTAHHQPIFDRKPTEEYQNIMELIDWVCDDTRWLTEVISRVAQTISAKPLQL